MSAIFIPESPPLMSTEDGRRLAEYLTRQMLSIQTFWRSTLAGHAGIYLSTETDLLDQTITQVASKLVGFDSNQQNDVGADSLQANDSIRLKETGLWFVGLNMVFDIDYSSANITREVVARFHNDTDGVLGPAIAGATVPRYGNFIVISGGILAGIDKTEINREYSVYLQTLTANSVTIEAATAMDFYVVRVSNFSYTGTE